jgi:hypothetical protein
MMMVIRASSGRIDSRSSTIRNHAVVVVVVVVVVRIMVIS